MNWPMVHDFAEEANLWLGLLVNTWIVGSAILLTMQRTATVEAVSRTIIFTARLAVVVPLALTFVGALFFGAALLITQFAPSAH